MFYNQSQVQDHDPLQQSTNERFLYRLANFYCCHILIYSQGTYIFLIQQKVRDVSLEGVVMCMFHYANVVHNGGLCCLSLPLHPRLPLW